MEIFRRFADLPSVMKACGLTFVAAVGLLIVLSSIKYFPAQFEFGFLVGRESYFYSWYAAAFYLHVISSPVALGIGVLQSLEWIRRSQPKLHRQLGSLYVLTVLVVAAPSGLLMAAKAGESLAIAGFATLAVATWSATWVGYRAAKRGWFRQHGQWMMRSFLLMCSAVMLRFLATIVNSLELDWVSYGALAWLSWLPMLAIYEVMLRLSGHSATSSHRGNSLQARSASE